MRIRESVSQATQVKHIALCGSVVVRRGRGAKVANGWAGARGTSSIRQRCVADSVAEWSEFRDECKLMDGLTNRLDCFG